ncbi:MAG: metallophosphoesterase family protein [Polyangiaceae bacterium]
MIHRALVSSLPALAAALLAPAALAAPKFLRLSYTDATATSMTVTWNTTANVAGEVQFGTSSGTYSKTVTATKLQANAGLGYIHEATLTGLSPGTKYFYIAGAAADGFSAESSFATGPTESSTCGNFKFAFLADNRPDPIFGGGDNWPQIMGQAGAHKPAFILNGGDLVIDGDKIDQWLALLGWTEPVAKSIPFMPAMGNHDTGPGSGDTANYNQIFALPRSQGANSSGTEDYYYFTYGNAIFVALSTDSFKGGSIPFANQAAWLDAVLTQNPKKWKFVYYHKPTYTTEVLFSISHASNEENQNAALVPVFDKHHVDVVFTSHNHWYERFEPSACATKGNPGSGNPCSVGAQNYAGGTVYLVSGGAGAFTIPAFLCGNTAGRAKCSGDHHYVLVDIQNESMKVETWGAAPQTNQVIDSITINKPGDACGSIPDAGVDSGADAGAGGSSGSTGTGGGAGAAGSPGGGGADASAGGNAGTGVGGAAGISSGGTTSSGGSTASGGSSTGGKKASDSGDDSGCGCRTERAPSAPGLGLAALAALSLVMRRRRPRTLT